MEEKVIEKDRDQKIAKKKVYKAPSLNVYGKLTELTAAGTGTQMENASMMGPSYYP